MQEVKEKIRTPRKIAILCVLALAVIVAACVFLYFTQRSKQQTVYTASILEEHYTQERPFDSLGCL